MKRFLESLEQKLTDYGRVICHASGINDPIPPEWTTYVTQTNIALEVIPDVLYDTLTYTSTVTNSLTFFQQINVKEDISNMQQSGLLPNPESFLIQAPRIFVKWAPNFATTVAASIADDCALLFNTAVCTAFFGNKKYGPYPAWMFSAGGGPVIQQSAAGAEATNKYFTYAQLNGNLYGWFPHLMISPLQSFKFVMSWPSGAVTLGAGNPAIQVIYDGQRARAVN